MSALGTLGYEVIEAETGDEALSVLRDGSGIDLVLSDVKMPGATSGIDLARRVGAEWPWIKVLLTSGYIEAEADVEQFEVIFKPYRVTELAERMHELLESRRPQRSPSRGSSARLTARPERLRMRAASLTLPGACL